MMRTKVIGDGAHTMKNLIKTRSLKEVSKYFATLKNKKRGKLIVSSVRISFHVWERNT